MKLYSLLSVFVVILVSQRLVLSEPIRETNNDIKGIRQPSKEEDMRQRIYELGSQVSKLQQENKMIIDFLSELKLSKISEEQKTKEDNSLNTVESDVLLKEPSRIVRRRRDAVVGGVAFTAYLTVTNTNMSPGQAIKFDQVILNDGQGYNPYTGAFTAPVTGTYLFTFYFDTRKLTFVRLVLNGVNEIDAVANPHTNAASRQSQSMGGNAAVLHVLKGQAVLVETYEMNSSEVDSSDTFRLCSFSGVLLY